MRIWMHQWPGQEIWIGCGLLVAILGAVARARYRDLDGRVAFALAGAFGLSGLVGARLLWALAGSGGPVRSAAPWSVIWRAGGTGFASFGGLAGAGAVAAVVGSAMEESRWRRFQDAVVPVGFVGLAVARVGCIEAGCDFGRRADAWWGLRYSVETPAHAAHLAKGWIGPGEVWSLATHPFPLYLVGVTVVAVLAGHLAGPEGNEAATVAGLYCAGRFCAEWFRSPLTDLAWLGGTVGSNQIWAAIGLAIVGYWSWSDRDG